MSSAAADRHLLRLLQLTSAALPVGAYSYSHGLEAAAQRGWVADASSVHSWQRALLLGPLAHVEVPIFLRCYQDAHAGGSAEKWAQELRSLRETRELRDEDHVIGRAMARLLLDIGVERAGGYLRHRAASHVVLFSLAAVHFAITSRDALRGLLFSFCENQMSCAIKLSLFGQTDAQKTLLLLAEDIDSAITTGSALGDDELGCFTHSLSVASSQHEQQYTRLFRS